MANPLETLGINIARQRERSGYSTQTAFADVVGVKQATVSAWEAGKVDIPYSTLYRIAEKLKTSPAALVDPSVPISGSSQLDQLEAIKLVLGLQGDHLGLALERLRKLSGPVGGGSSSKKSKPVAG